MSNCQKLMQNLLREVCTSAFSSQFLISEFSVFMSIVLSESKYGIGLTVHLITLKRNGNVENILSYLVIIFHLRTSDVLYFLFKT